MLKYFVVGMLALATCLCITKPAEAQILRRRFRVAAPASCHQPVEILHEHVAAVVAPIAVPVLIPSSVFQYMPAVTPTVVPQQPALAAMPAGASDIDSLIKSRIDAILSEYANSKISREDMPPAMVIDNAQQPAPVNQASFLAAMRDNCFQCHNTTKHSGGVTLFDQTGNFSPNVSAADIATAIESGRMPRNRTISQETKLLLLNGLGGR